MKMSVAVKKRIEYYLNLYEISTYKLARLSGITIPTLSTLLNKKNDKLIKLDTILHICEGLNITLEDFFDDKIFNDIE